MHVNIKNSLKKNIEKGMKYMSWKFFSMRLTLFCFSQKIISS